RGRVYPALHRGLGPDPATAVPALRLPRHARPATAELAASALCARCRRRRNGGILRPAPVSRRAGRTAARPGILRRRRPKGNDLARTAFTSGTTGDPKAVLHLHNTTNCAARFVNEGHRVGTDSVLLTFLPVGLNWGLLNVLQAIFAGCTLVLQEVF